MSLAPKCVIRVRLATSNGRLYQSGTDPGKLASRDKNTKRGGESCAAMYCSNNRYNSTTTLHRFPSDPER